MADFRLYFSIHHPTTKVLFPECYIDLHYDENSEYRTFKQTDWGVVVRENNPFGGICGKPDWLTQGMRNKAIKSFKF